MRASVILSGEPGGGRAGLLQFTPSPTPLDTLKKRNYPQSLCIVPGFFPRSFAIPTESSIRETNPGSDVDKGDKDLENAGSLTSSPTTPHRLEAFDRQSCRPLPHDARQRGDPLQAPGLLHHK